MSRRDAFDGVLKYNLARALNEATADVYIVNADNGWFEDDRTVGEDVALLHSEVSEMLEEFREHGLEDATGESYSGSWDERKPVKPEGFAAECADVFIRLLDTCQRRGVDLAYEFERKLAYNATREHRHGGKRL